MCSMDALSQVARGVESTGLADTPAEHCIRTAVVSANYRRDR